MKRLTTFAAAALLFIAPSCGGGGDVAGTYTVDVEETVGPMMDAMPKPPGMDEAQVANMMKMAKEQMAKMMESMSMVVNADGTYSGSAEAMGTKSTMKGTWTKEGDKVTFAQTHEDGKEKKDSKVVTFKDGGFELTEDMGGTQGTVYFKKK